MQEKLKYKQARRTTIPRCIRNACAIDASAGLMTWTTYTVTATTPLTSRTDPTGRCYRVRKP